MAYVLVEAKNVSKSVTTLVKLSELVTSKCYHELWTLESRTWEVRNPMLLTSDECS
jgi:hypothetical protein